MTAFTVLSGGAAVATALAAGVLYAFSGFVIAGLRSISADQAGAGLRR